MHIDAAVELDVRNVRVLKSIHKFDYISVHVDIVCRKRRSYHRKGRRKKRQSISGWWANRKSCIRMTGSNELICFLVWPLIETAIGTTLLPRRCLTMPYKHYRTG